MLITIIFVLSACTPSLEPTTIPAITPTLVPTITPIPTEIPYMDSDLDGLSDEKENHVQTNPFQIDSDGDGLNDYDEVTKYYTNPLDSDSDNDGIQDSDWSERREYTETLYLKMRILPPFNSDSMNDHFQDINVLDENENFLLFELIFYPDSYHIIEEIPFDIYLQLSEDYQKFLVPDPLMNFDKEMSDIVKNELNLESVNFTSLDVIEKMYQWESRYVDWMPGTKDSSKPYPEPFLDIEINEENEITFPSTSIMFSSKPRESEYSQYYSDELFDREWQMDHIILGKEMFLNKSHGSCGSIANFHSTILRSVGIPTRIIQTVPVLNPSDKAQIELLDKLPPNVKNTLHSQIGYNHFLVEAFVGGRWIRVNNNSIESNVEMRGAFIKVISFDSWKNASFARSWGYNRPYKLLDIEYQDAIHKSQKMIFK